MNIFKRIYNRYNRISEKASIQSKIDALWKAADILIHMKQNNPGIQYNLNNAKDEIYDAIRTLERYKKEIK